MVERREDRQHTPPSPRPDTADDWKTDEKTHRDAHERLDVLNEQTRRLAREVSLSGGLDKGAEFISMHERINRIVARSFELGEFYPPYLVHALYHTIRALDDGLTEGEKKQVDDRMRKFSLSSNMDRVIDKTIEEETGSAGEVRVHEWRQTLPKPSWE